MHATEQLILLIYGKGVRKSTGAKGSDLTRFLSVKVPAVTCHPLYCCTLFSNYGNIRIVCATWATFNIFARLQGGLFSRILLNSVLSILAISTKMTRFCGQVLFYQQSQHIYTEWQKVRNLFLRSKSKNESTEGRRI